MKEYAFSTTKNRIYLVVGKRSQYLVSEYMMNSKLHFFCSCPDFFFHALLKGGEKRRSFCHHILAVLLMEESRLKEGSQPEYILEKESYWFELLSDIDH